MKNQLFFLCAFCFFITSCHKDPSNKGPYLRITPLTELPPMVGAEVEISIESDVAWKLTMTPAVDWIQMDRTEGNGNTIIHLKAIKNAGGTARTVEIQATATGTVQLPVAKATIRQMPYNVQLLGEKLMGSSGDNQCLEIIPVENGGVVAVGYTSKGDGDVAGNNFRGYGDYWIVKLDMNRQIVWSRTFGGSEYDIATDVVRAADGGYVVAGYTGSSNSFDVGSNPVNGVGKTDIWVLKFDEAGIIKWKKNLGGSGDENFTSIALGSDGAIFVGASSYVAKLDGNGSLLWENLSAFTGGIITAIAPASNGGCVVVGAKSNAQTGYDCLLKWFNNINGDVVREKQYGGNANDFAQKILPIPEGYIMCGSTGSNSTGFESNHGDEDFWVLKIDNEGMIIKQALLGGTGTDSGSSICISPDGGYLLTGVTSSNHTGDIHGSSYGGGDVWVAKVDKDLQLLWEKNYGAVGYDRGTGICINTIGNFVIAGTLETPSSGGLGKYYILTVKDH